MYLFVSAFGPSYIYRRTWWVRIDVVFSSLFFSLCCSAFSYFLLVMMLFFFPFQRHSSFHEQTIIFICFPNTSHYFFPLLDRISTQFFVHSLSNFKGFLTKIFYHWLSTSYKIETTWNRIATQLHKRVKLYQHNSFVRSCLRLLNLIVDISHLARTSFFFISWLKKRKKRLSWMVEAEKKQ